MRVHIHYEKIKRCLEVDGQVYVVPESMYQTALKDVTSSSDFFDGLTDTDDYNTLFGRFGVPEKLLGYQIQHFNWSDPLYVLKDRVKAFDYVNKPSKEADLFRYDIRSGFQEEDLICSAYSKELIFFLLGILILKSKDVDSFYRHIETELNLPE